MKAVQFIFFLKVVLVFCFWLRFLFVGQFLLRQSAIRTRIESVPYDIRGQEEERGAPNLILRVQQADPSPGPGARRSKVV